MLMLLHGFVLYVGFVEVVNYPSLDVVCKLNAHTAGCYCIAMDRSSHLQNVLMYLQNVLMSGILLLEVQIHLSVFGMSKSCYALKPSQNLSTSLFTIFNFFRLLS